VTTLRSHQSGTEFPLAGVFQAVTEDMTRHLFRSQLLPTREDNEFQWQLKKLSSKHVNSE
jgi:hypothetical protein